MMSDFRGGGGGSEMTPKNRIIEGKNRIKGGGSKMTQKNRASFMYDPLGESKMQLQNLHYFRLKV